MECIAKNCSVTNIYDGCLLSCWLCDGHAHVKCAGFNGRHFDKIAAKESGLRWTCWNCRELDVDFYRLYKEAKKGFPDLNRDLNSLASKLKMMEKMFSCFEWSDMLSSPRRKKASGERKADNRLSDIPLTPNFDNLGGMFVSPLPSPLPATGLAPPSIIASAGIASRELLEVHADVVASTDVVSIHCTPNLSNLGRTNQIFDTLSQKVATTGSVPKPVEVETGASPSQVSQTIPEMCELVVVPPRKTVFVSRLSADTSVEKIVSYLRNHLTDFNDNDCKVLKFNYSQPRDIASFRIIVPEKVFSILVNKSFWPSGVLVREFIPRDRPRRTAGVELQPSKN